MFRLYSFLRSMSERDRLEFARWLIERPELLGRWAKRSTNFYGRFSNVEECFHPQRSRELPYADSIHEIRRGDDLAVLLADQPRGRSWWEIEGAPDLSFGYVDYEVAPLRDTRRDRLKIEGSGMRADLLLVSEQDGTPIVGEVKAATASGSDTDPVLALIQGLTLCLQLLSPQQMERLENAYPGRLSARGELDLYLLVVKPEQQARAKYQADLYEAARALVVQLPEAEIPVRRIVVIEMRFDGGPHFRLAALGQS